MKHITKTALQALTATTLAASSLLMAPTAKAADMASSQPVYADAGRCASQHVLSRVTYNFYHEVRHVPNLQRVRITHMSDITQTKYDPAVESYNVTRHYCSATAMMNDGSQHRIWYMVEEGQGFAGVGGMNVEFCVDGFDKWRIHDGSCRSLR